MRDLLIRVSKDWPSISEIAITENGAAYPEGPDANGDVQDTRRVEFIEAHIEAVGQAIAEGAPVKRYYAWSFMDNYEWAEGYAKRFGIVHVDFDTMKRTPKESAKVFSSIIHSHSSFWETVSQS
jgi:beta-glucosidase